MSAMGENSNDYQPNYVEEVTVPGLGQLKVGRMVSHRKFGLGSVKYIEPVESGTIVYVVFEREGSKWLVVEFANLSLVYE
jgi:DNA helicase-2/ATP-dependent DNA helicase PcrA